MAGTMGGGVNPREWGGAKKKKRSEIHMYS